MNLRKFLGNPPKRFNDPFIERIRSLVIGEGMLCEYNIFLMDHAIKNMPAQGSVVEIGSYGGLSTNVLLYFLRQHKRAHRLFNCDIWKYENSKKYEDMFPDSIDGRADISKEEYSNYMLQAYLNGIRFLSKDHLPYSFQLDSIEFFKKWNEQISMEDLFGRNIQLGGEIAFAYIDGNHHYSHAFDDFMNVAKYMIKGGFILLDDTANHLHLGSAQMMKEVKKDERFVVVDKKNNYLLQKK